jgi:hypothetical protein
MNRSTSLYLDIFRPLAAFVVLLGPISPRFSGGQLACLYGWRGRPSRRCLFRPKSCISKIGGYSPLGMVHDLRRSATTGMAKLEIAPHVIERILNHAIPGVAAIYNQHDYLRERREAITKWSEHVAAIVFPDNTIRENIQGKYTLK